MSPILILYMEYIKKYIYINLLNFYIYSINYTFTYVKISQSYIYILNHYIKIYLFKMNSIIHMMHGTSIKNLYNILIQHIKFSLTVNAIY